MKTEREQGTFIHQSVHPSDHPLISKENFMDHSVCIKPMISPIIPLVNFHGVYSLSRMVDLKKRIMSDEYYLWVAVGRLLREVVKVKFGGSMEFVWKSGRR